MNKIFENQKINIDNKYLDFKNNINIQKKFKNLLQIFLIKKKNMLLNYIIKYHFKIKKVDDDGLLIYNFIFYT
jgi:hypothetical protein